MHGSVKVAGEEKPLPAASTRDVLNVRREDPASFLFDVRAVLADETTSTTFRLVPEWYPTRPPTDTVEIGETVVESEAGQDIPDDPTGSRVQPGLYITRIAAADPGFRVPEPGLKVVDFPVTGGTSFTAAATDGVTSITYTSTVNTVAPRVDACGTLLAVHQVDLAGQMTRNTPAGTVVATFTSSYGIAPQFGALIVWEKTNVTSGEATRTLEATINQEPARPRDPSVAR